MRLAPCRFASTFQMLRGTLVIFAGFLTVTLLKRRLHAQHWLGIVLITAGAAIVGASRSGASQLHIDLTYWPHTPCYQSGWLITVLP